MELNRGPEMWRRAKEIIPMGTQLLSKTAEIFLPEKWPSYFSKAKGVEVWDLDGNKFTDMSIMGVGSCILGYADEEVNGAVKKVIEEGNMCTLNSPEEVELAELLLELHPWAGMARFARTGGEAMAVAVRVARAFTGKDKVAFCGYHGWHDWYLSGNLGDSKNLDGHLLPGLKPLGVPRVLKGTALPFTYNKIHELEAIAGKEKIGAIVMEPMRSTRPENGFLKKVREIASKTGAVLVFDEITSGFRMAAGGIHTLLDVEPDIAVYAKAVSNGFPMAAIVGRKEIMRIAEESFISSTYWTERIGPAAALATIRKVMKENVPSHLVEKGNAITQGWKALAGKHELNIKTTGIPPLTAFSFDYGEESQALRTLFTREMLAKGFLAGNMVYVSFSHTGEHIKKYLQAVDEAFGTVKEGIGKADEVLGSPVARSGFARLT